MGEMLPVEPALVSRRTVKKIQERIKTCVDTRTIFSFDDHDLDASEVPQARFLIKDSKNPEKTQKISAAIDVGDIRTVEMPWDVKLPVDQEHRATSAFQRLSIQSNLLFPQVHSFERGYYYADGDETSEMVDDQLTEAVAQEFLAALNQTRKENETDMFWQTQEEQKANKAKSDTLRNQVDQILERARQEKNIEEEKDDEGNLLGEKARYMVGETKFVVMKNSTNGICVVDIQGDTDFTRLLGKDDQDDPDQTVRQRRHFIIQSEESHDQRVFYGLVFDPVEYGTVFINADDYKFMAESENNIANSHEIQLLFRRLEIARKQGRILPPSLKGPDDLLGV